MRQATVDVAISGEDLGASKIVICDKKCTSHALWRCFWVLEISSVMLVILSTFTFSSNDYILSSIQKFICSIIYFYQLAIYNNRHNGEFIMLILLLLFFRIDRRICFGNRKIQLKRWKLFYFKNKFRTDLSLHDDDDVIILSLLRCVL